MYTDELKPDKGIIYVDVYIGILGREYSTHHPFISQLEIKFTDSIIVVCEYKYRCMFLNVLCSYIRVYNKRRGEYYDARRPTVYMQPRLLSV